MTTEANHRSTVDEIDFTALFAILWRQRKLIAIGTLTATLLAAALSFFIPKTYRSEGFYQLGNPENKITNKTDVQKENFVGIPIPLYKKSAPQFFNPNRLYFFAREGKSFSDEELNRIKAKFQKEGDINKWIIPIFAYSKGDMRELAQLPKDESNSVLGLSLSYEADSPQKTYKFVSFIGQYIRDCLLYVSSYDYVKDNYSKVISKLSKNENSIIDLQFNLLQNIKKMLDIKAILTKYPEAAKIENRQIVSVQEGGFRFLGPVTQLVGIESTLADQRRNLDALEREKEILIIQREYFSKCNDALKKFSKQGEIIFSQLKSIKREVFKNKDFSKGTVKEVFNNLNIDLQTFDLAFYTNCRFISGPTVPTRHIRPRKSVIVIITCFLSFFFFIVSTLILHWWQSNKKQILSAPTK
ncbi:MAG: hypothetical protein JW976_05630 [Syntrophaceae bacterium]|nr:hypothetical protein [Syntrophaceae bacterium]